MVLSDIAEDILATRYYDRDDEGNIIEDWSGLSRRVSNHIASFEETDYFRAKYSEIYYDLLYNMDFVPNTPCLMNAGSRGGLNLFSACFVQVPDDSIDSIMQHAWHSAKLFQAGAGVGYNFSKLRGEGETVRSSMRPSSGAVSFMSHIFNQIGEVVKQGGRRRAAMMGLLEANHPEIEKFIGFKKDDSTLTNFNISIWSSDAFMRAIENNSTWDLISRTNKSVIKTVKARELFEMMIANNKSMAEPGMIFADNINRHNPLLKAGYQIECVNPCVGGDTLIMTTDGPKEISSLEGKQFWAIVNGKAYLARKGSFITGYKDLYKLTTKEGYEISLTEDHKVLCGDGQKKPAHSLMPGDKIVLGNNRTIKDWNGIGNFEEGYLLGIMFGDGYINSKGYGFVGVWDKDEGSAGIAQEALLAASKLNIYRSDWKGWRRHGDKKELTIGIKLLNKFNITDKSWNASLDNTSYSFHVGFVRGLFDTDGHVEGTEEKGYRVVLTRNDREFLIKVQAAIARIGIKSKIYKLDNGGKFLIGSKNPTNPTWRLHISSSDIQIFSEKIGFSHIEKSEKLAKIIETNFYSKPFSVTVESLKFEKTDTVWDTTIDDVHVFDANGLIVSNCGEATLLNYENCCLGSINLVKHVSNHEINWNKLEISIRNAIRFLDDIVSANIHVAEPFRTASLATRRIGLGVTGFADALVMMGITYGSQTSFDVAEKIAQFMNRIATLASQELAQEKGTYPLWNKSWHKENGLPLRNVSLLAIAPEGSRSLLTSTSPSIEPNFGRTIVRSKKGIGAGTWVHPLSYMEDKDGNFVDNPNFVTTYEIPFEAHIKMQAVWQDALNKNMVSQAISKTNNAPRNISETELAEAYLEAWRLGCKGLTTYVDGSRDAVYYEAKEGEIRDENGKIIQECSTGSCDVGFAKI